MRPKDYFRKSTWLGGATRLNNKIVHLGRLLSLRHASNNSGTLHKVYEYEIIYATWATFLMVVIEIRALYKGYQMEAIKSRLHAHDEPK